MPTAVKLHTSFFQHVVKSLWQNISARLCILDTTGGISGLLNEQSSKASYFSRESTVSGTRASATLTDIGTYDPADVRWEVPSLTIELAAASVQLEFYQLFLVLGGSANRPKSFNASDISAAANTITVPTHGLANGEELIITPTAGSTLPAILAADSQPYLYQAANITTNTFQLSKDGGTSVVDFADAGTGSFYLKYAKGVIERVITQVADDGVTPILTAIAPGQNRQYVIGLYSKQV